MLDVSKRPPHRHGVERQGQRGQETFPLPEGQVVQLAERGGEVGLRPLGHLLQGRLVSGVERDGQGGVEQPLPAPLHLVAQPGHVLQGDLRLGGHGAAALEGEGLGRLEAHLLPFKRPRGLLGGYRPQVDGQVHRRSRRHEALEEAGGQRPGPLAQVQRADKASAYPHVAAVDLDLDGCVLVELGGRAAQGGRYKKHPQLAALQGVDGQPGPRQQAAQLVHPLELAHGVEAPVENAVAGFQLGQQPLQGFRGGLRLRGQALRLRLLEALPHPFQSRRVLSDEKLRREVQGVERPGEGSQLRLVDLQPHHLADAELHPVQAHRPVVVEVGQHEEQGQLRQGLGSRGRGFHDLRAGRNSTFLPVLRSGGIVARPLRAASRKSSNKLFQWVALLALWGWEVHQAAAQQRGHALGRKHQDQADDGHDDGGLGPSSAPLLAALRHQDEARPDDGEQAEAGGGVGHRRQHPVEGFQHCFLLCRGRAGGRQRNPGQKGRRQCLLHQGHSHPSRSNQLRRPSAGSCSAGGSTGSGSGRTRTA